MVLGITRIPKLNVLCLLCVLSQLVFDCFGLSRGGMSTHHNFQENRLVLASALNRTAQ